MFALLRKHVRIIAVLLLATVLHVSPLASTTWAKHKAQDANNKLMEVDTSKSYVLPYALVILGVALGVMIVARPSTRITEVKKKRGKDEDDDE